jgi:NADH:ubiquinone oxidoreductase subunit 5 (subunit L)/multisubunit Na+/H+ antiporter MnhA subunit
MPRTAGLFLLAATAICALPPLNGFISEVLIYYSLFAGLQTDSFYLTIVMMLAILSLAVIGGLAIFGFSRAFGITFLGSPRTGIVPGKGSEPTSSLFPLVVPAILILAIGLLPSVFLPPVVSLVSGTFCLDPAPVISPLIPVLFKVSLTGLILIGVILFILLIRKGLNIDAKTVRGPTWGCGYTAGTARQQYTASSFSANLSELAGPALGIREEFATVQEEDIFPENRQFRRKSGDLFAVTLTKITGFSVGLLRNIARLQTGNIRHYILYAFLFMLAVFGLLYLGLI